MYKVQQYDTDCEAWEDCDDIEPSTHREDAEDDMRAAKRRFAYPVRMRVVKEVL